MQEYYQEYVFRFWEYLLKTNNLLIPQSYFNNIPSHLNSVLFKLFC